MISDKLSDFVDMRANYMHRQITMNITGIYFRILGATKAKKIYALDLPNEGKFLFFDDLTECRAYEKKLCIN